MKNYEFDYEEREEMMELVDPFAFITKQCRIPYYQESQLLSAPFFHRRNPFAAAAAPTPAAAACSVPETPATQPDVVRSHSDKFQVNTTSGSKLDAVVSPKAPRSFDLNDVVSGISTGLQGLGVQRKEKSALNDAVCGRSDELGFASERKRLRERSFVTPPTRVKKKVRICDEVDIIILDDTDEMVNDVVGEDERGTKENSLKPPMENNKEVENDVVSKFSIDLGFNQDRNTTNKEFVSPTTAEFIENTKKVQNDVVTDKTAKTAQIEGDTEGITVVDDCKGKEHDTEEIDSSDYESDDDNEGGDTQEVAYEDELINSTIETETCRNHTKCLMDIMKTLAERSLKKKEEAGDVGEVGEVDFLETAKRRGYTFPTPRWKLN